MSKKALGKGIDALFADIEPVHGAVEGMVMEIPLSDIDPNRQQPRKRFDQKELNNLADSMRAVGVIQPITVAPQDGRYIIVAGERRWRAARLAGLRTIPALVREMDSVRQMEMALIENLQREDLNPIEEAQGIRRLMDECGLTQDAAAKRLGRSRSAIANLLRLLALPEGVLMMVREGQLSEGHARAIAGVTGEEAQMELAKRIVARGMNVRQAEQAAKELAKGPAAREKKEISPERSQENHEVQMVEETIRRALGTKVTVRGDQNQGTITIQYFSREDLERIYALVAAPEPGE